MLANVAQEQGPGVTISHLRAQDRREWTLSTRQGWHKSPEVAEFAVVADA